MYDWLVDFGASIFLFLQLWSVAEGSGEWGGGGRMVLDQWWKCPLISDFEMLAGMRMELEPVSCKHRLRLISWCFYRTLIPERELYMNVERTMNASYWNETHSCIMYAPSKILCHHTQNIWYWSYLDVRCTLPVSSGCARLDQGFISDS